MHRLNNYLVIDKALAILPSALIWKNVVIHIKKNGYRNRTVGNYRGPYWNNRSFYGQPENYNRHQMNVNERRGSYQKTGHGGIWR